MINYWTRLEPTSEFFMFAAPHKWFSIPSPPTPWSAHTHTHTHTHTQGSSGAGRKQERPAHAEVQYDAYVV